MVIVIEELIRYFSVEEYLNEAWKNSVEEGFVDETNRDNYLLKLLAISLQTDNKLLINLVKSIKLWK
ncbi:hypothetical protein C7H79_08495 [Nitrosomonas supralitoralis]|uniref:Uncharacterized protein n=2 Tax=Nitrosomonas supralitoralis TaxID=2116706 RepID=A0A2P7NV27_9PROT|nr:hypothetical protein C7H79_08495 [Nitrosomonas supralitoralis]